MGVEEEFVIMVLCFVMICASLCTLFFSSAPPYFEEYIYIYILNILNYIKNNIFEILQSKI